MPVFMITLHAYRSWNTDHPRGYIQRGQPGIKKTNKPLARHRDAIATDEPAHFGSARQVLIIAQAREMCPRRNWRLHGVSATPGHVHLVISWQGDETEKAAEAAAKSVESTSKRILGWALSKAEQKGTPPGTPPGKVVPGTPHGTPGSTARHGGAGTTFPGGAPSAPRGAPRAPRDAPGAAAKKSHRWFSRGGLPERVKDRRHLAHLMRIYLPKHARERGTYWIEPGW